MRIGVVGAGAWGTTLADLLAREGHDVTLWVFEPAVVESIGRSHRNVLYLPDAPLDERLAASGDVAEVVCDKDLIVSATPSHVVRQMSQRIAAALSPTSRPLVVSVSKGLEDGSHKTMTAVLAETLPRARLVALSGPSFAIEVYQRYPTAVVAASTDADAAHEVQQAVSTGTFRVYTSQDVLGVQLGGALKNVIAIAAGILHGLSLGNNSRAALITRGLAEMTRLGEKMGADPHTFAGLAGMGDLILTAMGDLSRNRTLGVELAQGKKLEDILATRRTVAEGVGTARAAVELGREAGVDLPIAEEVAHILFDGKQPERAVRDLMERELKPERWQ